MVASVGTFTVTGNTIRLTGEIGENPVQPDSFSEYSCVLDGDTLTMTAVRNQNGPMANPITARYVRAQ